MHVQKVLNYLLSQYKDIRSSSQCFGFFSKNPPESPVPDFANSDYFEEHLGRHTNSAQLSTNAKRMGKKMR